MDLSLTPVASGYRVMPESALGLLWLQTHFEPETWDLVCEGRVRLSTASIDSLCADAREAGLALHGAPVPA
jgi:hypothetical protein